MSTDDRTLDQQLNELDSVMSGLIRAYKALLANMARRREAMSRADAATLARCMEGDAVVVQDVARFETRRERVVGAIAEAMGSADGTRTTMTWIAERAPEGRREGLLERAGQLRELIQDTRKQSGHTKAAAEMLAAHMQGMLKQVHAELNHSKTYGRMGAVESGRSIVSSLDLTT